MPKSPYTKPPSLKTWYNEDTESFPKVLQYNLEDSSNSSAQFLQVYDLWGACHGYRWPLPAFKTSGAFFPSGERSRRTTNKLVNDAARSSPVYFH